MAEQSNNTTITLAQVESAIMCLREAGSGHVECVKTSDPLGHLMRRIQETSKSLDVVDESDPAHVSYKEPETATRPRFNEAATSPSTTPPVPTPPPPKPEPPAETNLGSTFTPAAQSAPAQAPRESSPETSAIRQGHTYRVPSNFDPVLKRITQNDPISYGLMVKVLGSESGLDNDAVSSSGAFSAGQFTTATFHERVWKNRNLLSPAHKAIVEDNMERHDSAKAREARAAIAAHRKPRYVDPVYEYRIKSGSDAAEVKALSENEYVVSVLAREHLRQSLISGETRFRSLVEERMNWLENPNNPKYGTYPPERLERLREHLERPMNFTDAKTFYLCGSKGGAELLLAHADTTTQDHRAKDYTTDTVARNNKPVFENPDGSNRSVPEYIDYMHERVGNQPLPESFERIEQQSYAMLMRP